MVDTHRFSNRIRKRKGTGFSERSVLFLSIISLVAAVTVISLFFQPAITGGFIGLGSEVYTDNLNLTVAGSSTQAWQPEAKGILSSLRLSGKIIGMGTVKVYLNDLLVLDRSVLETGDNGLVSITGAVIGVENNTELRKINTTNNTSEPALDLNDPEILVEEPINNSEEIVIDQPEELFELSFQDVCIDTCKLELTSDQYTFRFEIENAVLQIECEGSVSTLRG